MHLVIDMKKLIITLSVVLVAAIVVCFAPLKTVAYTVFVDKEETETYYESVPYEAIETYTEEEPYQEEETYYDYEPLSFDVINTFIETDSYNEWRRLVMGGYVIPHWLVEVEYPVFHVKLANTDTRQGIFKVSFEIYAVDEFIYKSLNLANDQQSFKNLGDKYVGFESLTIYPDSQETLTFSVSEIDMCYEEILWEYEISPGTRRITNTREVTKYKEVEKQGTVTNYKPVKKERTVTVQRPETHYKKITFLDYWLNY